MLSKDSCYSESFLFCCFLKWNKQNAPPCCLQNGKLYLRQGVLQAVKSFLVILTGARQECTCERGVFSQRAFGISSSLFSSAETQCCSFGEGSESLKDGGKARLTFPWRSYINSTFSMTLRSTAVGDLCTMANAKKVILEPYRRKSSFVPQITAMTFLTMYW